MNRFITLALFALGCAGADNGELFDEPADAGVEEPLELGQTAQALTWPTGYGMLKTTDTSSSGDRCWLSDSVCMRPVSKTLRFKFIASSCNSWWQTRVVTAHARWRSMLSLRGWNIQDPDSSGNANYILRCGGASGHWGYFAPTGFSGPDSGGDYTYNSGGIRIDATKIDADTAGKTSTEKTRNAENVVLHELLHSVGLGHSDGLLYSAVMLQTSGAASFAGILLPTSTELSWLNSYTP